jgi:hypothetical protein
MSRQPNVYRVLTGSKVARTDKAILFAVHEISGTKLDKPLKATWFPLSQVNKTFTDPTEPNKDWISVTEWICKQKDIDLKAYPLTVEEDQAIEEPDEEDFDIDELDGHPPF